MSLYSLGTTNDTVGRFAKSVGFTGAQANGINGNRAYVEKHNPWAQFEGSGPNQLPASTNQPLTT